MTPSEIGEIEAAAQAANDLEIQNPELPRYVRGFLGPDTILALIADLRAAKAEKPTDWDKGFERWFNISGALPDHVTSDEFEEYRYISAERFYQEAIVEVPKLLADVRAKTEALETRERCRADHYCRDHKTRSVAALGVEG